MRVGAWESEQWQSNGVESGVESKSRSKYELMYSKGSEIVGDVRNVGNTSEEVRSKVWAMTVFPP